MPPLLFLPGRCADYPNYLRAVRRCGGLLRCSRSPEDAEGCDALLLPGGGDPDPALYGEMPCGSHPPQPERDTLELTLLRRFLAEGKPILGICRGLQMLNIAFGGTLLQDLPGHGQINGEDRLHPVFLTPSSPLFPLYGFCALTNSAHHQAVGNIGAGLQVAARAADGVIEALFHPELPVFGVQWHPERLMGAELPAGTTDGRGLFDLFLACCRRSIQEKS